MAFVDCELPMEPEVFSQEQDKREIGCTSHRSRSLLALLMPYYSPRVDVAVYETTPFYYDHRIRCETS